MSTKKLAIFPDFPNADQGDGGVRRVVDAQRKYLPAHGFEIVDGTRDEKIERADIISTHIDWITRTAADDRIAKPVVSHCHGLYWSEYDWPSWAHKANNNVVAALRKADVATAPSKWVAQALARGMWLNTPVLYHGVEPLEWTPGDKTQPYVLWNKTRIDPVCEIDTLTKLAGLEQGVHFISTFGDDNTGNVTTTGKLPFEQAKQYVQDASVYLCNTRETFGIGTLEAMLCETPILGWDWGGQREIVEHKVTGWLATPGDFESLQEGLAYCLKNRKRMGKAARKRVLRDFTWEKVIGAYAEVYDKLLARERGPKVTVVIPAYNLATLLPRTIRSVQAQTYQDWEAIIVNDASTDNTLEVANTIVESDKRFRVLDNERNLYLAGALNAGIAAARSSYVIPVDADNEIAPNTLEVLADALDNDRGLDIVYGRMEVVEENGKRFVSDWPPREFSFSDQMHHKNQITSTAMYRKKIWERVGGYRRRCRTAEDADFWCRATSMGGHAKKATDAPLLIYYNRHESMSHTTPDWPWNEWYAWHRDNVPIPYGSQGAGVLDIPTYEPAKVTVIVPVGPGHEEVVVDAVESLVAQTYSKWDVIVVNDSGKPLPWIHPFARVLTTAGSQGPAHARNMGIAACRTALWLPLDADDILMPNALELLTKNYEPGFYVYGNTLAHETGELLTVPEWDCKKLTRQLIHAVTALYETQMWRAVGGFDTEMKGWEDWDFVLALAAKGYCGKRVPSDLPIFQYRIRAGGRREKAYAAKEDNRQEIIDKYKKYVIDGEPLMACGGCGQKVAVPPPVVVQSNQANTAPANMRVDGEEAVLVEYTGDQPPRSWRGPATNTVYRFGNSEGHRTMYVKAGDLPLFNDREEFRRTGDGATVRETRALSAAGV